MIRNGSTRESPSQKSKHNDCPYNKNTMISHNFSSHSINITPLGESDSTYYMGSVLGSVGCKQTIS